MIILICIAISLYIRLLAVQSYERDEFEDRMARTMAALLSDYDFQSNSFRSQYKTDVAEFVEMQH
jgi:hypothetical protein